MTIPRLFFLQKTAKLKIERMLDTKRDNRPMMEGWHSQLLRWLSTFYEYFYSCEKSSYPVFDMPWPVPWKPWQSWSSSNLCRRQKFLWQRSHWTGIISFTLQPFLEHLLLYTCRQLYKAFSLVDWVYSGQSGLMLQLFPSGTFVK